MLHVEVHGLRPDLILTDFQLGLRTTSEEIVAAVAARLGAKPPTIMLTGAVGQQVGAAASFADRILHKPTDIDELVREIEALLGKRP
jgi:DNA-binding response OmpR family regulator